jgi:hypothetical protein
MNCLQYALEFWNKNPDYGLFYNSHHVVNLPDSDNLLVKGKYAEIGFLPLTEFGYVYFSDWYYRGLIDDKALQLLIKYFATHNQ